MENQVGRRLVAAVFALASGFFVGTPAFADNDDVPAFCRTGKGHPVFGRRWCLEKGFGLPGREPFVSRLRPFPDAYDPENWEDWKEVEKRARKREREYWKRRYEDEREWAKHRHDLDRDVRFERQGRTSLEERAELEGWEQPRDLDRRAADEIERQRRTLADERSRQDWEAYERY